MLHMQGKKISGRHTTVIPAAAIVVETARSLDEVSKVALGLIKSVRGNAVVRSLKIVEVNAGLRIKVRGPNSVQELFIYTSNPRTAEDSIRMAFDN